MEVTEEIYQDMKKRFDDSNEKILSRTNVNTQMLRKEMYLRQIDRIKSCRADNASPPPVSYRNMPFDVVCVGGIDRLIVRNTQANPKCFVHMEEIFQIIYDTHVANGHCGRNRLEKEINTKYKNITREMMRNFLYICFICAQKRPIPQQTQMVKPQCLKSNTRFPRCQVNVMDMEVNQDGPYKFILVYEDHLTKFVQLRPLKTCSNQEIAGTLLKIFSIFGVPSIMHSDNGREFASEIIKELANQWNQIKMVHGKSQVTSLNKDILELIEMWMEKNRMQKWSKCLHFVQLMKNKCPHKQIDCTPYEAMFGAKCNIGLNCNDLGRSKIAEIETEEELQVIAKEDRVLKIKSEGDDNNCDEGSVDYMENYLKSLKQEHGDEVENENSAAVSMPPLKIIKLSNSY